MLGSNSSLIRNSKKSGRIGRRVDGLRPFLTYSLTAILMPLTVAGRIVLYYLNMLQILGERRLGHVS